MNRNRTRGRLVAWLLEDYAAAAVAERQPVPRSIGLDVASRRRPWLRPLPPLDFRCSVHVAVDCLHWRWMLATRGRRQHHRKRVHTTHRTGHWSVWTVVADGGRVIEVAVAAAVAIDFDWLGRHLFWRRNEAKISKILDFQHSQRCPIRLMGT